jgi:hypothetical protein
MMSDPVAVELEGLPHQIDLWTDTTDHARIGLVGPYGCGKSLALAIKQALLRQDNPECDGMLVVPTYSMFRLVHHREWPGIWRSLGMEVRWRAGSDSCWEWPWGARTWVRSAETPDRLAGPNLSDVSFDEPGQMHRDAWDRGSIRKRDPRANYRQCVLTGTPEGINWFADIFDNPEPPNRTIRARGWHPSLAGEEQRIRDTYGYDESLFKAYGRGEFVPLRQGRCYQHFSRSKHVVAAPKHDPHVPLVLACDFNVDIMRWEVMQFGPDWIRVLDEIKLGASGSTQDAAREFVNRWQSRHKGRVTVTGDAAGQARSTSGRTDYQVIREELAGVNWWDVSEQIPKGNPKQKDRVDATNYHLAGRGKTVEIAEHASELIRDLERVRWKPGTTGIDKSDLTLTHASDAATYAVWMLARPASAAAPRFGGPTDRPDDLGLVTERF